ncbi:MAG: hypothetical protein HC903_15240 [Methylacidiphilales bacterium]|nr:hypothetical protein [Candidatus Methylacidiphilales bacterium]NJR17529.1 hypothetical protein [Calothrix sp. CSU_2_0]
MTSRMISIYLETIDKANIKLNSSGRNSVSQQTSRIALDAKVKETRFFWSEALILSFTP